ncbi:hypothetical protein DTO013E5_809 [Penicillium roqueforti]|uniref:uncharacterized protein n=1 Tax=Penicillium roqueforti TaxID=5082 RepID=UPI00190C0CF5|nr:uncharacterized protein LCP9604111_2164 [Penicillium roqueforti]KAF9252168.1 hypothetical protein LCP9604111_2164 [Penicillium roqueforti]KAI1837437.1 hypothetical protein CBS147337_1720 [Penicillium roqueforti]KAI2687875.1 hypothetical protein LCP963914a_3393 [Penicillium roqueforti]KAI2689746.1 hypothetical protein CBS147355_197 [Penicillium roqueforti]KAI2702294.1 hypothetical protein CBS147372_4027 [Penicillium roqueforti]
MVPTIIGVNEASKGTRDHEERRRESARQERCYLSVQCMPSNGLLPQSLAIHNARVYLGADKKMYITKSTDSQLVPLNGSFYQHPDFPPDNTSGFVTITGETPPTLRWVYVDLQTHELRWGGKQDSEGNICGPFDWTQDEERITLEGWEGWLAVRVPDDEKISEVVGVENSQDLWRLYFDNNDDGADLPQDAEVLEVTIKRTAAES